MEEGTPANSLNRKINNFCFDNCDFYVLYYTNHSTSLNHNAAKVLNCALNVVV